MRLERPSLRAAGRGGRAGLAPVALLAALALALGACTSILGDFSTSNDLESTFRDGGSDASAREEAGALGDGATSRADAGDARPATDGSGGEVADRALPEGDASVREGGADGGDGAVPPAGDAGPDGGPVRCPPCVLGSSRLGACCLR